ncbi:MlaE family ABC transporter permease [Marinobacter salinisoli]|uniref:MlaE family ABC transporter permease n=1 Tax=Marinobacter salinisoli TaxID=2769486 RepID=UPI0038B305C9
MFAAHRPTPGEAVVSGNTLSIRGDWTLPDYAQLQQEVNRISGRHPERLTVDFAGLGHVDTAGAVQLAALLGRRRLGELIAAGTLPPEKSALMSAVCKALEQEPVPPVVKVSPPIRFLSELGQRTDGIFQLLKQLNAFIGQTLAAIFWLLPRPWRWRLTPFVSAIQDTGFNALPIVALLTFLVGAVVAFLGATVLQDFGATIYTVNLVAFSFLREFGVLLAAILLAGRTASSFTAHIGAMKVNQEVDAIRTLGLNPIELLVIPRVLAMMVSLPILTFVGMIAGMVGGATVCALSLDIYPPQFMAIVERDIELRHFLVGLSKAPVFAFLIAVIGCLEGFKVSGSAQSVGEHTTSSVVQSIFTVILFDSIAALFFMEMGW